MLQARLFSYGDTQRYRLGVNFNHIPVNAPVCPFQSYHRDGKMRTDGNLARRSPITPTARGSGTTSRISPSRRLRSKGTQRTGTTASMTIIGTAGKPVSGDDAGAAAGALREHGASMGDASLHVKQRHVANCKRADPAYGAGSEGPRAETVGVDRLRSRPAHFAGRRRSPVPSAIPKQRIVPWR